MSSILRGTVKWFNDAKGFGFINHTSGKDVFVHYSVILTEGFKTLKDGELVEYELTEGPKGMHAAKVQRLAESATAATAENNAEAKSSLKDSIEIERGLPAEPTETYVTEMVDTDDIDSIAANNASSSPKEYL